MAKSRAPNAVLFVCSRNRLRSPTAKQVFASRSDLEVASAGTDHDADVPLSAELVRWFAFGSGTSSATTSPPATTCLRFPACARGRGPSGTFVHAA